MVRHAAGAHAQHRALSGVRAHGCRGRCARVPVFVNQPMTWVTRANHALRWQVGRHTSACPGIAQWLTCAGICRHACILSPGNAHKHASLGGGRAVQGGSHCQCLPRCLQHQPAWPRQPQGSHHQHDAMGPKQQAAAGQEASACHVPALQLAWPGTGDAGPGPPRRSSVHACMVACASLPVLGVHGSCLRRRQAIC